MVYTQTKVSRDSSVSTAARYGLDGPEIESWWVRYLPSPFRSALGPTQPPVQCVQSLIHGGKASRAWRRSPTPPGAQVKK